MTPLFSNKPKEERHKVASLIAKEHTHPKSYRRWRENETPTLEVQMTNLPEIGFIVFLLLQTEVLRTLHHFTDSFSFRGLKMPVDGLLRKCFLLDSFALVS